MRRALAVCRKELRDGLRDVRSVLSALVFPLMAPAMLGLASTQISRLEEERPALTLLVEGGERAPLLIDWLEDHVSVREAPPDAEAQLMSGRDAVLLRVPEGFGEDYAQSQPAQVELVSDSAHTRHLPSVRRVERLLEGWSAQTGAMRLIVRGVDPTVAQVLQVEGVELGTPERRAGGVLGDMVALLQLMTAFFCNLYLAIDVTAGERERRSLEPLLLTPAPRGALVVGKWLAGATFGVVGTLLSLGLTVGTLRVLGARGVGIPLSLDAATLAQAAGVLVPLTAMGAAFQMLVAGLSRSFKEAQTWLSLTLLLPTLPGLLSVFEPINPSAWMMAVPGLAQQVLLRALLSGAPLPGAWALGAAGSCAVLCAVFLGLHQRHLARAL